MVGTYILSVTAAAMLCGLVRRITRSDRSKRLLKLVTGTVMAAVILSPLAGGLQLDILPELQRLELQVQDAVDAGNFQLQQTLAQDIRERTAAYILDKAAGMGLELQVQVRVSEEPVPVPVSVTLRGQAGAVQRSTLTGLLVRELGIGEEEVIWKD